jgi:hypothetical protein
MPYCVHCGVELAASEPRCPLCDTAVVHPDQPWKGPLQRPYPEHLETAERHVNRRYGAYLASILLLVPMTVTLLVDLLTSHRISWSLYVLGGGAFVFCCGIVPFYLKSPRPYFTLLLDTLSALLYLFLIAIASNGIGWYLRLAMPLTVFLGTTVIACSWVLRRKNTLLVNVSDAILFFAAFIISTDCTIDLYMTGALLPDWSLYAFMPLLALAAMLRIVNRRRDLVEKIRRRLYF